MLLIEITATDVQQIETELASSETTQTDPLFYQPVNAEKMCAFDRSDLEQIVALFNTNKAYGLPTMIEYNEDE